MRLIDKNIVFIQPCRRVRLKRFGIEIVEGKKIILNGRYLTQNNTRLDERRRLNKSPILPWLVSSSEFVFRLISRTRSSNKRVGKIAVLTAACVRLKSKQRVPIIVANTKFNNMKCAECARRGDTRRHICLSTLNVRENRVS